MHTTVTLRVQVDGEAPIVLAVESLYECGNPLFLASSAENAALTLVQRVKPLLELAYGQRPEAA